MITLRLARPRLALSCLTFLLLILSAVLYISTLPKPAAHTFKNGAYRYAPTWSHSLVGDLMGHPPADFPPPTIFDELLAAPPLDSWNIPSLQDGSTLLTLHVFSTGTKKSRERREFIRSHSPLNLLPPELRRWVEMKFILGRPDPEKVEEKEVVEEEIEIEKESERWGDVVRLEGLRGGDNMNQGKSWEWAKFVGKRREGQREAQWYLKCDDDTFPILPNLIDLLVSLDPSVPTYIGTALGHWIGYHYYMEGMMYGFSSSVVKTLAAAKVPDRHIQYQMDEDARMGAVMYSLPSRTDCLNKYDQTTCDPLTPPLGGWAMNPPSPDLRTGLVRYDVGNRLGYKHHWWIADTARSIGWHGLKEDENYLWAYDKGMKYFVWQGQSLWTPPDSLRRYQGRT